MQVSACEWRRGQPVDFNIVFQYGGGGGGGVGDDDESLMMGLGGWGEVVKEEKRRARASNWKTLKYVCIFDQLIIFIINQFLAS